MITYLLECGLILLGAGMGLLGVAAVSYFTSKPGP